MRGATESEVNDVFDRINTYGHRLSDQERRQAGVENEFSNMVRTIACTLRGDASADVLPLKLMPSISIDLPMTKHGYQVQANEVFWVNQGILRSTDLRDSMDEQCIAYIAACIVSAEPSCDRRTALDALYMRGSNGSERVLTALEIYGSNNFADEFKYCIDEILKVCDVEKATKRRSLVFKQKAANPFPSVFAILVFAFHDLIVKDGKKSPITPVSKRRSQTSQRG